MAITLPAAIGISMGSSLLGGLFGKKSTDSANAANAALQREFAQNAVQWKVADAKKAGISPLAALGAPTMSPSVAMQSDDMGQAVRQSGQQISSMLMQNELMKAEAQVEKDKTQAMLNIEKARTEAANAPRNVAQQWVFPNGKTYNLPHTDLPLELDSELMYMEMIRRLNPSDYDEIMFNKTPDRSPVFVDKAKRKPDYHGSGRGIPRFK